MKRLNWRQKASISFGIIGAIALVAWPILRANRDNWLVTLGYRISTFDRLTSITLPIFAVLCVIISVVLYGSFMRWRNAKTHEAQIRKEREYREVADSQKPVARFNAFHHELASQIGQRGPSRLSLEVANLLRTIDEYAEIIDTLYDRLRQLNKSSGGDLRTGTLHPQTISARDEFSKALDKKAEWFAKDLRTSLDTIIASGSVPPTAHKLIEKSRDNIEQLLVLWDSIPEIEAAIRSGTADSVSTEIDLRTKLSRIGLDN